MKKIALILTVILTATFCNNLQAQQQQETLPMSAVDVQPEFQGENAGKFARWVFTQLKYPEQAVKENLTGKVIVQFTISKTGDVKDIKVLRGAHPALDAEALRVISMSYSSGMGLATSIPPFMPRSPCALNAAASSSTVSIR